MVRFGLSNCVDLAARSVVCRLVEVSLDKPPKYDALPYIDLGKPSATSPNTVHCNDGYLPITKNCYDALTGFDTRKSTRLWVDAHCIDQSCVAESSSQVTMMGEIYKSAARVIVWLVPGDPESDFVSAVMGRLRKLPPFALLPFQCSPQIGAYMIRKISNLVEGER